MDIYVVQPEDNIYSIAERYGISVEKIIQDNGLAFPYHLIIGQAIVIAYPKQTHTIKKGDTLQSIADLYGVELMKLLRNNPFLSDRQYLYEGETLVISYNTLRSIITNGFCYPYIPKETLVKILPDLTYLSIFNYTISDKGEIVSYQDDSNLIKTAVEYGTIPLMLLSTYTQTGESNVELAYKFLLNERYQENSINNCIDIMKAKGYKGVNLIFNYLNEDNQSLYEKFLKKADERMKREGFLLFVTINYKVQETDDVITLEQIDYSKLSPYVNGLIFVSFIWGVNHGAPIPVTNVTYTKAIIDSVVSSVQPDKILIGCPFIGYDWILPYQQGYANANTLSLNSCLELANEVNTIIQFDEKSQTPYFYYKQFSFGLPAQHMVWFIDVRTINELSAIIIEYGLNGGGVWNVMIYYQPIWTLINSQFDIVKSVYQQEPAQ